MVPTITTLLKIAVAFNRPVSYFVEEQLGENRPVAHIRSDDRGPIFTAHSGIELAGISGPYGRFFDGPNAFRPDAALTVVELGDLAAKPDLRAAMVLVLMHAIRTFAGALPIGQRKLVVIDEAWSLLASEDSAAALAEAARTYRKLNAAAVFISQRLEDFVGQAIVFFSRPQPTAKS